jgi:hypothetical protein
MDGEAVSCGPDGIASFDRIRRHDADLFMWAFDLIELNGDDVRRDPLAVRKATLERSAETISFSVRSDCSLMRTRICRECFSNGEVLPPRAMGSEVPFSRKRCTHRIAELTLTSNCSAASRRDPPSSTKSMTRILNSPGYGPCIGQPSGESMR